MLPIPRGLHLHLLDLMKIQKKKRGKGKGPTTAEGKGKTKVAIKGKCFHCNVDEHWKRNCPKYLAKKKEKEEHKSEALEKFKEYKPEVENLLSRKIKILRSDRGGEYMDLRFQDYMIEPEIQFQLSAPVETTIHTLNNVPLKRVSETPFELWKDAVIPDGGVDNPLSYKQFIRILLSIATFYEYEIWQMDVKTAFLNGNLEESIFMSHPEGFITQAQFQMKDLGETQYVLGIQIIRDHKNKMLALSQVTYIDKMLIRYSMENSKKDLLPFWHGTHLSKEQFPKRLQEVEDMRHIPYALVVGSLIYDIGVVANSKEPRSHKRGKHIERKYHLIRKIVQRGDALVTKIASEHNIADPFTKILRLSVLGSSRKSKSTRYVHYVT
ncbi:gag/pol protein [Cucumis melo var. makuwa]|uniref:Gag/pol protein n=1 Tax=Cucumis melo var. makuwa TaxID=1194695 RepID=A0A5A7TYL3_CUCMM|nr:gag/pol protein [Cucumis melo var. makuwa]